MAKTAASVAKEISARTSKNLDVKRAIEDESMVGGIEEEVEAIEETSSTKTGTPYDLVKGKLGVDYFGPLDNYGFITTPHGEYGMPTGKILRFTYSDVWDPKEGQHVRRAAPHYEDAPPELMDYLYS